MFIAFRLVVKKLVDEELVIIDVDAKMFVVNRFRNLFVALPNEYVESSVGIRLEARAEIEVVARVVVPETDKFPPMVVLPVESVKKLVFSVQDEPLQNKVEELTVPTSITPIVFQRVEVPVVIRT